MTFDIWQVGNLIIDCLFEKNYNTVNINPFMVFDRHLESGHSS